LLTAVGAAFSLYSIMFVRLLLIRQPDNTMASTKLRDEQELIPTGLSASSSHTRHTPASTAIL
jgi:hypothetical protein